MIQPKAERLIRNLRGEGKELVVVAEGTDDTLNDRQV